QELCRAMPANAGLRLNLGMALQMSGRQQEAIPQFEQVLEAEPNSLPALMSLGVARLETNDPARAVGPFEKAIALQPSNSNVRGMLANALLSQGRAKDAAPHFRKLTTLTPGDPKAWFGLGRSYETLAKQAFEELDKKAQGSAEWLALVADSRVAERQYRSAFYFYRQALEKQPNLPGLHLGLAEIYRATGHADWASVEDKKEKALPHPASQSAYTRAREYNELALQAFSHLGQLPESVELHALKAEISTSHGQHLEAASEWRAALKLAPGDERLERELATALYLGRDYQTALAMLQSLAKREPGAADLHFFLGDSLLQMERAEEALPYLEASVKADPKLLPAQATLGMAYAKTGKSAQAIPHLEAALETDEDGSLHYQLARAYQAAGNAAKSREAMSRYQEIQKRSEAAKRDLEEQAEITAP
ncbi:MAG: tetratricopeptide repeat protein, partial [Acidobacteriota bacterium]|nr:tetratricopeptide repeat protein [Acidobacteriota bacterium]